MQGDQVGAPLLVSMQPEKQRLAIKAELWESQLVTPALGVCGSKSLPEAAYFEAGRALSCLLVHRLIDTPTLVCSRMGCLISVPFLSEDSGRTRNGTERRLMHARARDSHENSRVTLFATSKHRTKVPWGALRPPVPPFLPSRQNALNSKATDTWH